MASTGHPRTWVEISGDALRHNFQSIRQVVEPVPIAPVIKSNAYGHGLPHIARLLKPLHVWGVCVAYGSEALRLRELGWKKPILVLSFWRPEELHALLEQHVALVAWDETSIRHIGEATLKYHLPAQVHIKADTGTTRIGFSSGDLSKAAQLVGRYPLVQASGFFSHLANSEEVNTARTKSQIKRFATLEKSWPIPGGLRHLSCTAAALRYPEARFGLIRLGIGLYGLWPSSATKAATKPKITLEPVLSWKTTVSQIKRVPIGTAVGYGSSWTAKKPTLIATLPVGYSDGYYRSWSNVAWVMIRNHRAPVIGRVSMNLVTVDVTKIPGVRRGDIVTLLGPGITSDTLATLGYQTLHYEVTTTIHPDIPRLII